MTCARLGAQVLPLSVTMVSHAHSDSGWLCYFAVLLSGALFPVSTNVCDTQERRGSVLGAALSGNVVWWLQVCSVAGTVRKAEKIGALPSLGGERWPVYLLHFRHCPWR